MAKKSILSDLNKDINDKQDSSVDIDIDNTETLSLEDMEMEKIVTHQEETLNINKDKTVSIKKEIKPIISCLRNETVIVRYIIKPTGFVQNPKNPQYGGLSEGANITLTVPMLRNGSIKNPLTKEEKAFLEAYMGLEEDALSVYNRVDNYWINRDITLTKQDKILYLSDPIDYIDYKILLSNDDLIAPSLENLQEARKGTWKYVLIREGEENKVKKEKIDHTKQAWKYFGSIENNKLKLKTVLQLLKGTPISKETSIDTMQVWMEEEISKDPKMVVTTIIDPYLDTKVLLFEALDYGIVRKQGELYYTWDNRPLSSGGKEPTLKNVVEYLNNPLYQAEALALEAKVKNARE